MYVRVGCGFFVTRGVLCELRLSMFHMHMIHSQTITRACINQKHVSTLLCTALIHVTPKVEYFSDKTFTRLGRVIVFSLARKLDAIRDGRFIIPISREFLFQEIRIFFRRNRKFCISFDARWQIFISFSRKGGISRVFFFILPAFDNELSPEQFSLQV